MCPAPDIRVTDTFTYKANDGNADSNAATVTIQVEEITPPPPIPSSFFGEIHIIDNPPQIGDLVQVFLPGAGTPVITSAIRLSDSTLVYTINVPGDIAGTPAKEGAVEGETLTFKINGRVVATGIWHSGVSAELNFHPPDALPGGPYVGDAGAAISFTGQPVIWVRMPRLINGTGRTTAHMMKPVKPSATPGRSTETIPSV